MSLSLAMMISGVSQTCSTYWCFWYKPMLHSQYVLKYYFANYDYPRAYSVQLIAIVYEQLEDEVFMTFG